MKKILTSSYSLIILDVQMAGMDGYETIAEIRKSEQKEVPIVSVTALAMVGNREKCIEAGADAYVSKPIDIDYLISLLNIF